MNFEQWQATREYRADISDVSDFRRDGVAQPGYLYEGGDYWIAIYERNGETWYSNRWSEDSTDLEEVERALYEFAGHADEDNVQQQRVMEDALRAAGLSFAERYTTKAGVFLHITLDDHAHLEVGFQDAITAEREYVVILHSPDEDDGRWVASFATDQADQAAALCLALARK